MENFQSLVSLAPWTMIFTLCNLLILTAAVKHFLFKPVMAVLEARKAEVDGIYGEAEKAETEAKAMRSEYEQQLAGAEEKAGEIVRSATDAARRRSDEIVQEAKDSAQALRRRTEEELARDRRRTEEELRGQVSGIALELAGRVVEKEIDGQRHQQLIDEFLSGLGDVS